MKLKFNPLYLWIALAWCASKVLQLAMQTRETVWETGWNRFLDAFGEDGHKVVVYGTTGLATAIIIGTSALFLFMDLFLRPESLRKYKVQIGSNEPVEFIKMLKALPLIIFNQVFVYTPFIFCYYYAYMWRGIPNMRSIEDFPTTLFKVIAFDMNYHVWFYFSHRLLHSKFLYKHVHKIHHEWTSSIAIIALYCHPLEHLFVNLGIIFSGSLIIGCHIATFWIYFGLHLVSTLADHSGYHLPFLHSSEYHDYHHLKFNTNYGANGWMDYIFGTDTAFRKTINHIRHRTLFTTESARERFPDPPTPKEE